MLYYKSYVSCNYSKYDHLLAGRNFAASAVRRFILGKASDLFVLILRLLTVTFSYEISNLKCSYGKKLHLFYRCSFLPTRNASATSTTAWSLQSLPGQQCTGSNTRRYVILPSQVPTFLRMSFFHFSYDDSMLFGRLATAFSY